MAVQAQPSPNPPNHIAMAGNAVFLADLSAHRPPPVPMPANNVEVCDFDPRTLFVTFPFVNQEFPSCQQPQQDQQQQQQALYHQTMLQPGSGGIASTTFPNFAAFQQQQQSITNIELAAPQPRKRRIKPQTSIRKSSPDLNLSHHGRAPLGTVTPNTGVSTGLRLTLDDDLSTVTNSRPDLHIDLLSTSGMNNIFGEDISVHAVQQQHELNQLIKVQIEQLRHALLERMQMHSKVFLATVEEQVSLLLRGREIELENVTQRNLELEQRIKQIGLETQIWQSKAKSFEAMVAMLRANLQQALLAQSKEQNPIEGHGDNDADDAASEHIDGSDEAQKTRAAVALGRKTASHLTKLNRACRSCRVVEACVLLVPCMHLCLCSDCQRDVEQCPICNSQRSACVEVYLS